MFVLVLHVCVSVLAVVAAVAVVSFNLIGELSWTRKQHLAYLFVNHQVFIVSCRSIADSTTTGPELFLASRALSLSLFLFLPLFANRLLLYMLYYTSSTIDTTFTLDSVAQNIYIFLAIILEKT